MVKKPNPMEMDYGKVPPQAIDLEEAVIGTLMLEPGSFSRVSHILKEPGIFYKESHRIILKAIIDLHEKNIGIDLLTVSDKLRVTNKLENVGGTVYLSELMSRVASDKHLEFHCMLVTDKYLLRELIRIGLEMQNKAFDETTDPSDIAEWAEEQLQDRFDLDIEGKASFKDALASTLLDISNKAKGITSTFIKTGDERIDKHISFRLRQICLIAGAEGCGKTKWMIYLASGMLNNNDNLRILWFSMEDSKEQIVRSFISIETRLTTKQLQSINYTLDDDQMKAIKQSTQLFENYKIEFVDRVSSIRTIMRKTKQFKDRNTDSMIVLIIDNLGLITTDSFYKGTEKDDYLAGKLKELSDQTDSSIFLLHHITKENARAFNLKEGYRPRKDHIKGSTRILDYVQQAIMVNLPRKYKDLVQEEKQKAKIFDIKPRTGKFDKTRFLIEFWSINDKGDKNTEKMTDLPDRTWEELKFACGTNKKPDGTPMGVGYLIKKYIEYSVYIDEINRPREPKYHKQKLSIYTFITTKMYNQNFKPKTDSRTYYLYGNEMKLCKDIEHIFIAEAIKNRDGSDTEDQNLIRYRANLDYNIFEPLTIIET